MTQEERWVIHYNEVKTFIETYHRNPSKYVDSERGLRNWVKQQKKLLNAGALEGQRLMMFNELLGLGEKYIRVNQYQWARAALVHGADALAAARGDRKALWGNAPMCLERRGNKKGVLLQQHSPNQVRE